MRLAGLVPDRLDRYVLQLLAGPFTLALVTLLVAQLLERLLRLFDFAAASGAPLSSVLVMAANLVPHYLGLALPAAFTAAIFLVAARLGDDNELDIMLGTGRSILRIAMPCVGVAIVLSAFSLYLHGYLQPLARYGYHVAVYGATEARWTARVEDNRFVKAGHGIVLAADEVGRGRELNGVFVERDVAGREEITTARSGRLVSAPGGRLLLQLEDGFALDEQADGKLSLVRFKRGQLNEDFGGPPPFRARGDSVRELTFAELWHSMREGGGNGLSPSKLGGEFHGRLARALVFPVLPLLAIPLGLAAKRGRRTPGVVFACLALLLLQHSLNFGESLAEKGQAAALPAVWTPFVVFVALCVWMFRRSRAWPGENPVSRTVAAIETAFEDLGRFIGVGSRR